MFKSFRAGVKPLFNSVERGSILYMQTNFPMEMVTYLLFSARRGEARFNSGTGDCIFGAVLFSE